jgi:hypothetical protein
MSLLRIDRQGDDTNAPRADVAKSYQQNVNQSAPSPAEGSLCLEFKGPKRPKGNVKEDFDLAHVPHSKYQLLEHLREILVSLKLVSPRGVNQLAWRMLHEIKQTHHLDNVSQTTDPANPLAIQLTEKLARVSAVHIMNGDQFILDSAIKLEDGTWVFRKVRSEYGKNPLILFQTEGERKEVKNESLPLKLLKAR